MPIVSSHPELAKAIDSFIRANAVFESSFAINGAIDTIVACDTLDTAFASPIQRQVLSMDGALHWLLFLSHLPAAVDAESGPALFPLDANAAIKIITTVYDVGIQNVVLDHTVDDDDSSEEDDSE